MENFTTRNVGFLYAQKGGRERGRDGKKEKMKNSMNVVEPVCVCVCVCVEGYDCIFPLDKEQWVIIKGRVADNLVFKDLLTTWKV